MTQVWGIPEGGLTENVEEPLVDLKGHGRKVRRESECTSDDVIV
jgi:hypothetical protein